MKDPFKNEYYEQSPYHNNRGILLTTSLFYEYGGPDIAVYTLKDRDIEMHGKKYPSLKKLYLEMEDVSEYEFANKYLAGWKHWKAFDTNIAISKHISEWREELEIKLRAKAIKSIIKQATDKSKPSYQAAKWIADKEWIKRSAGAPSKEERQGELRRQTRITEEISEELQRMEQYH